MKKKSSKKAAKKSTHQKRHNKQPKNGTGPELYEDQEEIHFPDDFKPQHRIFVLEYLRSWNKTEAYMAAFPNSSYDAARANAARLIANDSIREIVTQEADRILDGRRGRLKVLVTESLDQDLSSEISDYVKNGSIDLKNLAALNPRSIQSITFETQKNEFGTKKKVTLKLNDRAKAREHAMKLLGLLKDDGSNIIIINPPPGFDEV